VRATPLSVDVQTQDFARLAFRRHFEGPAADFAVGGEPLRGGRCVDGEVESLPAKRALDAFGDFHIVNMGSRPYFVASLFSALWSSQHGCCWLLTGLAKKL
jgi:hypothetical protein